MNLPIEYDESTQEVRIKLKDLIDLATRPTPVKEGETVKF